uniref:C-type lectin domain-containing protein n=1 Tax=Magallana gigas TaxID=29159 RepID=A0A8W8NNQ4_MAGGI
MKTAQISRDFITGTCYCCDQVPGLDDQYLSNSDKRSFKTGFCPFKYTGYKYNQDKICLRYEESLRTYQEAVDICQREGGDLIRVDSLTKHNILKDFVEKKRSLSEVEVWVQGIRDGNFIWRDAFDELYLFSRDVTTGTCYCCDKKQGVDDFLIPEFERETFITGNCALRYKGYEYNNQKVCLRYEETLKTYHEAADVCQREGGDLIRVDSITKHNIMSAFIEEQRLADRSEVWVQGIRDSNLVWRYHDSTELKYTCLSDVSGNSNSNYMRAKRVDNYFCADTTETYKAFYLCEMFIRFI